MFLRNKKGSALLQVLVLGSVIAAVVLLVLRLAMTRTTNVVKTKRKVSAKAYAESCLSQYNAIAMVREENGLPPLSSTTFSCNVGGVIKTVNINSGAGTDVKQMVVEVTNTDKLN